MYKSKTKVVKIMLRKIIRVWVLLVLSSMTPVRGMGPGSGGGFDQSKNIALKFISSPEDKLEVSEHLCSLFDQAREKVCVAVYWLTDELMKKELIKLKQRDVDVQVILDESTCKFQKKGSFDNLVKILLDNNIVPIVYPSEMIKKIAPAGRGIMHSKFVVIDDKIVFHGSANFTATAINPEQSISNYEQVLTIHDSDIARRFLKQFENIKKDTLHCYLDMIGQSVNGTRVQKLAKIFYDEIPDFQKAVSGAVKDYKQRPREKANIGKFFGIPVKEESINKRPSLKQKTILMRKKKYSEEYSRADAFRAIQKHKQHKEKQDHKKKVDNFKNSRNRMPVDNRNFIRNEKGHASAAQAKK
jgi:hypothetical protein